MSSNLEAENTFPAGDAHNRSSTRGSSLSPSRSLADYLEDIFSSQDEQKRLKGSRRQDSEAANIVHDLTGRKIAPMIMEEKYDHSLPAHLEEYKREYERTHLQRVHLPLLSTLSPRTQRKLANLPAPQAHDNEEMVRLQKEVIQVTPVRVVYEKLNDSTVRARAAAELLNEPERWRLAKEVQARLDPKATDSFNVRFKGALPSESNSVQLDASAASFFDKTQQGIRRLAEQEKLIQLQEAAKRKKTVASSSSSLSLADNSQASAENSIQSIARMGSPVSVEKSSAVQSLSLPKIAAALDSSSSRRLRPSDLVELLDKKRKTETTRRAQRLADEISNMEREEEQQEIRRLKRSQSDYAGAAGRSSSGAGAGGKLKLYTDPSGPPTRTPAEFLEAMEYKSYEQIYSEEIIYPGSSISASVPAPASASSANSSTKNKKKLNIIIADDHHNAIAATATTTVASPAALSASAKKIKGGVPVIATATIAATATAIPTADHSQSYSQSLSQSYSQSYSPSPATRAPLSLDARSKSTKTIPEKSNSKPIVVINGGNAPAMMSKTWNGHGSGGRIIPAAASPAAISNDTASTTIGSPTMEPSKKLRRMAPAAISANNIASTSAFKLPSPVALAPLPLTVEIPHVSQYTVGRVTVSPGPATLSNHLQTPSTAAAFTVNPRQVLSINPQQVFEVAKKKEEFDHKSFLESLNSRVEKELGIVLNHKLQRELALKRGANVLIYHINKKKLRAAYDHFTVQARRLIKVRREKSVALLVRMVMGFLARRRVMKMKDIRRKRHLAKLLRERKRKAFMWLRFSARAVLFVCRMRKFVIVRRYKFQRSVYLVQRIHRGVMGRVKARKLRSKKMLNTAAVAVWACVRMLGRARRSLTLKYKMDFVDEWMENIAEIERQRAEAFREQGAALSIQKAYRGYRMRVKLQKILYWQRLHHIVNIQAHIRGFIMRRRFRKMLAVKRARDAARYRFATDIQRIYRGFASRRRIVRMLESEEYERALRRQKKRKFLESYGSGHPSRILRRMFRGMFPESVRHALLTKRCIRIQRVWRGHRARRRCKYLRIMARVDRLRSEDRRRRKAAMLIQRILRGFLARRVLYRKKWSKTATVIQCMIRFFLAKRRAFHRKKELAAYAIIRRYMSKYLFIRRKRYENGEGRVLKEAAVRIQTLGRRFISRQRRRELAGKKRSECEVNQNVLFRQSIVLGEAQLRILQESMNRPIGKKVKPVCGTDCPCLGPVQALFISLLGIKGRKDDSSLALNKLDSNGLLKYCQKIHGLTVTGTKSMPMSDALVLYKSLVGDATTTMSMFPGSGLGSRSPSRSPDHRPRTVTFSADGGRRPSPPKSSSSNRSGPSSRLLATPKNRSRGHSRRSNRDDDKEPESLAVIPAFFKGVVEGSTSVFDGAGILLSPTDIDILFGAGRRQASQKGGSRGGTGSAGGGAMAYEEFVECMRLMAVKHMKLPASREKKSRGSAQRSRNSTATASSATQASQTSLQKRMNTAGQSQRKRTTTAASTISDMSGIAPLREHDNEDDDEFGGGGDDNLGLKVTVLTSRTEATFASADSADDDEDGMGTITTATGGASLLSSPTAASASERGSKWSSLGAGPVPIPLTAPGENPMTARGDPRKNTFTASRGKASGGGTPGGTAGSRRSTGGRKVSTAGGTGEGAPATAGVNSRDRLLCPLETLREDGDLGLLFIVRMFLSLYLTPGEEEWLSPVLRWIDLESKARVGKFVGRIQRLVRRRQGKNLMNARSLVNLADDMVRKHLKSVIKCQSILRMFVYRRRAVRRAQVFLIKYDPFDSPGYWYNPSTGVSQWTKPKILGMFDSRVISLPQPGLEVIVKCSNCKKPAAVNCTECEDSYCKICYDSMHCKGRRLEHTYARLPYCSYCKYQMASKNCSTCVKTKPKPGSIQELMKPNERGLYCDSCYGCTHDERELALEKERFEKKRNERMFMYSTKEAYLVGHQLHQKIVTDHKYDCLLQSCEECGWRGASWRCLQCEQVYCNKCLVGLHSMGGPFAHHVAEPLPYYTPEMHANFAKDSNDQRFQIRLEEVKITETQRRTAHRDKSATKLQAWWRCILGQRLGKQLLHALRKHDRRAYRRRKADDKQYRRRIWYRLRDLLGLAPPLPSDTREESALKKLPLIKRYRGRTFVDQNMDDWGFAKAEIGTLVLANYRGTGDWRAGSITRVRRNGTYDISYDDGVKEIGVNPSRLRRPDGSAGESLRKGIPKTGFDVGTVSELLDQASLGGFRLPGRSKATFGESVLHTSMDLSQVLAPGDLIRIQTYVFRVRDVDNSVVVLDRKWRGATSSTRGTTSGADGAAGVYPSGIDESSLEGGDTASYASTIDPYYNNALGGGGGGVSVSSQSQSPGKSPPGGGEGSERGGGGGGLKSHSRGSATAAGGGGGAMHSGSNHAQTEEIGEVVYRLPSDTDEPLSKVYWAQYYQTKFFVSSPVMQVYFHIHKMTAAQLARGALMMAKISRDGGMEQAAIDWKNVAERCIDGVDWASSNILDQQKGSSSAASNKGSKGIHRQVSYAMPAGGNSNSNGGDSYTNGKSTTPLPPPHLASKETAEEEMRMMTTITNGDDDHNNAAPAAAAGGLVEDAVDRGDDNDSRAATAAAGGGDGGGGDGATEDVLQRQQEEEQGEPPFPAAAGKISLSSKKKKKVTVSTKKVATAVTKKATSMVAAATAVTKSPSKNKQKKNK